MQEKIANLEMRIFYDSAATSWKGGVSRPQAQEVWRVAGKAYWSLGQRDQ